MIRNIFGVCALVVLKQQRELITYRKHILSNGLMAIVHEDHSTPLVTVNVLYNVGARDEESHRTGFAHLFEHLMFGGTRQVPEYDRVVDGLGGESNAFTNNDFTNYYLTVPAQFLDKALWLEADRMRLLDFSQQRLDVQRQVVTEEYNQRYVNRPYGDVWMLLRPLCYKTHPYRWNTIGSTIRHVQQASLEQVEQFFYRYYRPDNAILCVAGNVDTDEALSMIEDNFGDIGGPAIPSDGSKAFSRSYPQEHEQIEQRWQTVTRSVPNSKVYMAFHMCHRLHPDYCVYDLLSDVLSNGNSSRLYNHLVKEQGLFTEIDAYISGETDPGLFVVSGSLPDGVSTDAAEEAVWQELRRLAEEPVSEHELAKVVNKSESSAVFGRYKVSDRAFSLCYYEWLGQIDWVNDEVCRYKAVRPDDLQRVARDTFRVEKSSILEYLAEEGAGE